MSADEREERERTRQIRVLIAEDMKMLREALVALLEWESDLIVVAEVDSGATIVSTAVRAQPDVAIIDVELPELDGLSAARALHDQVPGCRTLILTGLGQPAVLRRAMSLSVAGFMLKDAPPLQLVDAVREVAAGRRVVDPQLAMAALCVGESPLTDREREALGMVAEGAEPLEIASMMNVSVGTARNYLTKIVLKLDARNRVDAIRIAREAGWI